MKLLLQDTQTQPLVACTIKALLKSKYKQGRTYLFPKFQVLSPKTPLWAAIKCSHAVGSPSYCIG